MSGLGSDLGLGQEGIDVRITTYVASGEVVVWESNSDRVVEIENFQKVYFNRVSPEDDGTFPVRAYKVR